MLRRHPMFQHWIRVVHNLHAARYATVIKLNSLSIQLDIKIHVSLDSVRTTGGFIIENVVINLVARGIMGVRWSVRVYLDIRIVWIELRVLLCLRRRIIKLVVVVSVVFLWLLGLHKLMIVDLQYFRKGLISDAPIPCIFTVAISTDVISCALLQFVLF